MEKLPVELTHGETRRVLAALPLPWVLPVKLLYGSGLRLMEGVRLRVQDVDMERCQIVVRDGKGAKDRVTMLAAELVDPLQKLLVGGLGDAEVDDPGHRLPVVECDQDVGRSSRPASPFRRAKTLSTP